jgi:hypothetical protein
MARPNSPYWHPGRKRWRVRLDGKEHWAPLEIGPHDRTAAWAWLYSLNNSIMPPAIDEHRCVLLFADGSSKGIEGHSDRERPDLLQSLLHQGFIPIRETPGVNGQNWIIVLVRRTHRIPIASEQKTGA